MHIPDSLTIIGFNKRSLNYDDFEDVCNRLGVKVFRGESVSKGLHFYRRGFPIIWLNKNLKGFELCFVAWHELTHFLLHDPDIRFFVPSTMDKIENEANCISICCIIPLSQLKRILRHKEDHDYSKKMIQFRCEVLLRYGF